MSNTIKLPNLINIAKDFFKNNSHVIGINTLGENSAKLDNVVLLGTKAGPTNDLFNLVHEMAHFIEINNARCYYTDWDLGLGKWNRFLNCHDGFLTNQAIEREIRCFGIQLHLMEKYDLMDFTKESDTASLYGEDMTVIRYMAELCDWIDGFYHYYPKDDIMSYSEKRECAYAIIESKIQEEYNKWSMDKIHHEWNKKIRFLERRKRVSNV